MNSVRFTSRWFACGFTLIELVVVMAIIGILAVLILAAVQHSREAARRVQCVSNLHQIGIAIHNHHDAKRALPPGAQREFSFHVALLPYIEQVPLHDRIDFSASPQGAQNTPVAATRLSVLLCPSDPVDPFAETGVFGSNYAGNAGSGFQAYGFNGAFQYVDPRGVGRLRLSDFTDGASQTAAVSEIVAADGSTHLLRSIFGVKELSGPDELDAFAARCLEGPHGPLSDDWSRGTPWTAGDVSITLYNHILTPNQRSCTNGTRVQQGAFTAASLHGGMVNVLFADGHVASVESSVDLAVWRAMGSRNGHEPL